MHLAQRDSENLFGMTGSKVGITFSERWITQKREKMDEVFRCVNLNVHYSVPEYVWDKIDAVFKSMDFYDPTSNVPSWKGDDFYVEYSLEPSGMQFSSNMSENLWQKWYGELKKRLSDSLGYEIGEPEDGFDFFYDWK